MKHTIWLAPAAVVCLVAASFAHTKTTHELPPRAHDATTDLVADDSVEVFAWTELRSQLASSGRAYLPFLDRSTLSAGVYSLSPGSTDRQRPHDQDEVYYVVSGKADFRSGDLLETVSPGSIIFVAAQSEHRFENIKAKLDLLVFFSKAPVE